jgi:hypothetical protein
MDSIKSYVAWKSLSYINVNSILSINRTLTIAMSKSRPVRVGV